MQRGNYPPNPYSFGQPFNNGDSGFRSPTYPVRYQSSPVGRFHQQYVPHHNGPRRNSSNHFHMKSPKRMDSPLSNQQYPQFDAHTPSSNNMSRSFSSSSGNSSWSASSERGRTTPRGQFMFNKNGSPRFSGNFTSPRNDPNCNPGGCTDITLYYNQDMIQDPWANMKPIPVNKST